MSGHRAGPQAVYHNVSSSHGSTSLLNTLEIVNLNHDSNQGNVNAYLN